MLRRRKAEEPAKVNFVSVSYPAVSNSVNGGKQNGKEEVKDIKKKKVVINTSPESDGSEWEIPAFLRRKK